VPTPTTALDSSQTAKADAAKAPAPTLAKAQTGAEALIRCLEAQGVEYVFGLSGGAAMPIFDALVDSKIKLILVRHEQGATHMADGFARATGKPGVVLVTSGPGATNTVTGLLTALMDSAPMIVLTGQTISPMLGKDAFQEADVTGITYPVVKHSYLVKSPNDIPRITREAFHLATTGRPGPVLIDLPKDVTSAPCTASLADPLKVEMDLPGYKVPGHPDEGALKKAAMLLARSRKRVCLAIETFVTMTTHATALCEQVTAEVQRLRALRNAIARVTLLAAGFRVLFLEHGPQPETMPAVSFHFTRGGATVAPVTTGAAKLLGVV